MGSERNFGIVFGAVFSIFAVLGLAYGGWYWPFAAVFGLVCLVLAFVFPEALRIPNRVWFRFGQLLHSVISPVVMFLVFAITFVPIGIVFRLRRKDLLEQGFDRKKISYWNERTEPQGNMSRQF
ncbi:hypothetical protein SAMN04488026_11343 [Aliiruegeria lutimaris]|uniref:SxtJ n=2 Tax=Aliiruegeria lutimaris TaxID=571298 RepID=A0A1G9P549_9RHOB|nr:hypothetical protein SAMN04488026_11343 [Aliiruegeria lutimaris]